MSVIDDIRHPSESIKGALLAAIVTGSISLGSTLYFVGGWHATTDLQITEVKDQVRSLTLDVKAQAAMATSAASLATATATSLAESRARNLPVLDSTVKTVNETVARLGAIEEHVKNTDATTARHDGAITRTEEKLDQALQKLDRIEGSVGSKLPYDRAH